MVYYRSRRIIDGKLRLVIADEDGKIVNRDPSKEELKGLRVSKVKGLSRSESGDYSATNTCPRIRKDNGKPCGRPLTPGTARRERDKEGKKTGRWICKVHYDLDYQRNDPNSQHNIMKSLRDRRTGNQRLGSSNAKGDLFEELTDRWRGVKRLSIEKDNYTLPFDHSKDPELGIIQTKGRLYNDKYKWWSFSGLETERFKDFDYIICYCSSKDGKRIEKIYIFPKVEIIKRKGITIYNNPSRGVQWYDKYGIKDENILTHINEIWKEIIENIK